MKRVNEDLEKLIRMTIIHTTAVKEGNTKLAEEVKKKAEKENIKILAANN